SSGFGGERNAPVNHREQAGGRFALAEQHVAALQAPPHCALCEPLDLGRRESGEQGQVREERLDLGLAADRPGARPDGTLVHGAITLQCAASALTQIKPMTLPCLCRFLAQPTCLRKNSMVRLRASLAASAFHEPRWSQLNPCPAPA